MKVICISGHAGSGKDTVAEMMCAQLRAHGYRVLITHYADLVKYVCRTFFDWNGEKDVAGRTLLQYVGTDKVRSQSPDYWVNFVASMLTFFDDRWDVVLIPDCRFPNEVEMMRHYGFDTVSVRVERDNFETKLTAEQQAHSSETAMDNFEFDYVLHNHGSLDDLRNAVVGLRMTILEKSHEDIG